MHSEVTEDDIEWEHLLDLKIFRESVCLIKTDSNLNLKVEEDAIKELETIDKEINVVAITGLYRTGKSVLLNQLAQTKSDKPIFGVGHATAAMTRGIWATCLRHPQSADQVLMLLDTEGLGDIKKGDQQHDNKIFSIATLLSSTLIYNIMGPFNQDALEKLTFITQMSEKVVLSKPVENKERIIESAFPTFVLCMRDFYLELQNPGEDKMSPKEYLEDCLQNKYGNPETSGKFNTLREAIKRYFRHRSCFTFCLPTATADDLKNLDSSSSERFTEGFKDDLKKFSEFVYKRTPKMMLNGSKTTGKGLVSLVRTYVQCVREGSIPCVGEAAMLVADVRNRKLIMEAVESFTAKIKTIQLPTFDCQHLNHVLEKYRTEEIVTFTEEIIYDENNIFLSDLKSKLDEAARGITEKNRRLLFQTGIQELERLHESISKDVDRGIYAHKDGLISYKNATRSRDENFRKLPETYGDQKPEVVAEFKRIKEPEEKKILSDVIKVEKEEKVEEHLKALQTKFDNFKKLHDNLDQKVNRQQKEADSYKVELRDLKKNLEDQDRTLKFMEEKVNWFAHRPAEKKCVIL